MYKKILTTVISTLAILSALTFADDTELYVFNPNSSLGSNPKVLIIFDNSGSMNTIEEGVAGAYDPLVTYPGHSSSNAYNDNAIYWVRGGIDNSYFTPTDQPDSRRFYELINGCASSITPLENVGRYTDFIREYKGKNNKGAWIEVQNNSGLNGTDYIDCLADIKSENNGNADGESPGFPTNDGDRYSENIDEDTMASFAEGTPITLFTANYLRWYYLAVYGDGEIEAEARSRLQIAKEAIVGVIPGTPSLDFGLMVFNLNYPNEGERDGGRVVAGIKGRNDTESQELDEIISNITAETQTPLCETLFEAYNYIAGKEVVFGDADSAYTFENVGSNGNGNSNSYTPNVPSRDEAIETDGKYLTPMGVCPDTTYIIYITDGVPVLDKAADTKIKEIAGLADSYQGFEWAAEVNENDEVIEAEYSLLPDWAQYIYENDVVEGNEDVLGFDHKQNIVTYTIGFGADAEAAEPLLKETANRGGGEYLSAINPIDLTDKFTNALLQILAVDSSLTSPSIASNNFDRTETFDSAYFAMFLPQGGKRWVGNLKKLKVNSSGQLVDKYNTPAINDDGSIKEDACTIWSFCTISQTTKRIDGVIVTETKVLGDGNDVKQGGVLETLKWKVTNSYGFESRKILSNDKVVPASGVLLKGINALGASILAEEFGVAEAEVEEMLDWIKGIDVDDANYINGDDDARDDIMGDPLHSKPLAINYGSKENPDIRIIIGTNHGMVHMFKDVVYEIFNFSYVDETWAYIPYELLKNVPELRENSSAVSSNIYGMDGSPVAHIEYDDAGILSEATVFIGMRRGGKSYYALDISNAEQPKLKWIINPETAGFGLLGQTWSKPVVTKIKTADDEGKLVLVFGGGYDPVYDLNKTSKPSEASEGNVVFIVDAETGALIHKFDADGGASAIKVDGMNHSIVSSIATLDSINDGYVDRLYASDVGGNVWRMDMPGIDKTKWSGYKFAALGGSLSTDFNRRVFSEPVVAQTQFSNIASHEIDNGDETSTSINSYQNVPYDAVALGTGNRSHPLDRTTNDMFYVLQDRHVVTRTTTGSSGLSPAPAPLTISNLYDITNSVPESTEEHLDFGGKKGWYYDFSGVGEKTLAAPLIINGKVYFTSFTPPAIGQESVGDEILTCDVEAGNGRLYIFDLHKGYRATDTEYIDVGERVPDTPQVVIPKPEEGETPYIYLLGVGKGDVVDGKNTGTLNIGNSLGVNKVYHYTDESK